MVYWICHEINPKKASLGNIEVLASEVERSLNVGAEDSTDYSFHDASSKSPISYSTPTVLKPRPSLIPRPSKNTAT